MENQTDFGGLLAPFDLGQKPYADPRDVGELLLGEALSLPPLANCRAQCGNVSNVLWLVVDGALLLPFGQKVTAFQLRAQKFYRPGKYVTKREALDRMLPIGKNAKSALD